MASKKSKTFYVDLNANKPNLVTKIFGKKSSHDFSDIQLLRKLMSNEKARILLTIKSKKPKSIYALSKLLKRDFKSVREDVLFLDRFDLIDLVAEKSGKRESLMPILKVDKINLEIEI